MDVWFYSRIETAAERPTHALNTGKNLHRAPPERLRRTFCLLTQTYHGCPIIGKLAHSTRSGLRRFGFWHPGGTPRTVPTFLIRVGLSPHPQSENFASL